MSEMYNAFARSTLAYGRNHKLPPRLTQSGNVDRLLDEELLRGLGEFDRSYLLRAVSHLKGDRANRQTNPRSKEVMSAVRTNRQANPRSKEESLASRCRLEIDTLMKISRVSMNK